MLLVDAQTECLVHLVELDRPTTSVSPLGCCNRISG